MIASAKAQRYRQTEKGKAEHRRNQIKYQRKVPAHIKRARGWVNGRLKRGTLTRKPCEVCGDPKSEAHHPDHWQPHVFNWLCRQHHLEHHRALRMAQG
jgi:hypothetical protein